MTSGHAQPGFLPSEDLQLLLRKQLLQQEWSVRETENCPADPWETPQGRHQESLDGSSEEKKQMLLNLEEDLQRQLGTRVGIRHSGKRVKSAFVKTSTNSTVSTPSSNHLIAFDLGIKKQFSLKNRLKLDLESFRPFDNSKVSSGTFLL